MTAPETTSTRPYMLRALLEWCTDNGLTPHIAVRVDKSTQVPMEFVRDGQIVLNISYDATSALQLGNDYIEFKARFGGQPRDIVVPVGRVVAIYARENGQGMAFPPPVDLPEVSVPTVLSSVPKTSLADVSDDRVVHLGVMDDNETEEEAPEPPPKAPIGAKTTLKRVK